MNELDARGYSCPEPVLMTKTALKNGTPLKVLVDSTTPLQNITRFAQNAGHKVESQQLGDEDWEIVIR